MDLVMSSLGVMFSAQENKDKTFYVLMCQIFILACFFPSSFLLRDLIGSSYPSSEVLSFHLFLPSIFLVYR